MQKMHHIIGAPSSLFLMGDSLFPRNLELRKFRQKLAAEEKTRNHLCVTERAGKRAVRRRFFGNAAVVENGVEIQGRAFVSNRRLNPPLYHVHKTQRMRIERAVSKRPVCVPCPLGGCAEEIAVERNILSGKCPLFHTFAPSFECVRKVGLGWL